MGSCSFKWLCNSGGGRCTLNISWCPSIIWLFALRKELLLWQPVSFFFNFFSGMATAATWRSACKNSKKHDSEQCTFFVSFSIGTFKYNPRHPRVFPFLYLKNVFFLQQLLYYTKTYKLLPSCGLLAEMRQFLSQTCSSQCQTLCSSDQILQHYRRNEAVNYYSVGIK